MLILSRVCADFRDKAGRTIFSVTPSGLLAFHEAPEDIRQDPLFDMLLRDGSLEAVTSVRQKARLEADPAAGTDASGKAVSENIAETDTVEGNTPKAEKSPEKPRRGRAVKAE